MIITSQELEVGPFRRMFGSVGAKDRDHYPFSPLEGNRVPLGNSLKLPLCMLLFVKEKRLEGKKKKDKRKYILQ